MPYGIGRMMRLRRGISGVGCAARRLPLGRGLIGTAVSILALNDLADPQGYLRSALRRLIHAREPLHVIGFEPAGKDHSKRERITS
jgi:hypothetical protein